MMTDEFRELRAWAKGPDQQKIEAQLERFTRHSAILRIFDSHVVVRSSQVFNDLVIEADQMALYTGPAVVGSVVNAGSCWICEVKLSESGFKSLALPESPSSLNSFTGFANFLEGWQRYYRVHPEFKVVVADMQMFLMDLQQCLNQIELRTDTDAQNETAISERFLPFCDKAAAAFDALHERFEELGQQIDPELRPVHAHFTKRQLHPLTLCSPFAHRTYHKPLGYAGDYEMVNMILRNPLEGKTLYAKALNVWFLKQWPAQAHRNRISYLVERLEQEALRGARRKQPIRVLNLGCGPAHEVLDLFTHSDFCDHLDLTLWDFNDETIQRTGRALEECKRRYGRKTRITMNKKSVHQVLKEGARTASPLGQNFDYIYCAGLFDYLTDRTCKQLVDTFYSWLAADGLIAVTNVVDYKPFRHMLEYLLDWNLIYRGAAQAPALLPERAHPDYCRVVSDETGVNLMVEARKPAHD